MKTTMMIIMTIMSMGIGLNLFAATITVDNNFPSIGDYKTLQEAHNHANSGDTILVYPSQTAYSGISIYKKLHIIGAGYGHDFSKDGVYPSKISGFTFYPGSEESIVEGFELSSVTIKSDKTIIRHNLFTGGIYVYANNAEIISNDCIYIAVNSGYQGTIIKKNKFIRSSGICISIKTNNEVTISNNIMVTGLSNSTSNAAIYAVDASTSLAIINNYIEAYYSLNCAEPVSGIVSNNIINSTQTNCKVEYYNNLCSNAAIPDNNGNILNADMSTVFVDRESYNFHLSTNSPATGAGANGVDMGIYGGNTPFLDNYNLPEAVPSIIRLTVPAMVPSGSNTLNVTIEATSGNSE